MNKILSIILCSFLAFGVSAENSESINNSMTDDTETIDSEETSNTIDVESLMLNDSTDIFYVNNIQLYQEDWDKLAHPAFWKIVMRLSPDSCIINIGETRQVIEKMSVKDWEAKSKEAKNSYRDSVRESYGLAESAKVFMTTGKSDFYNFDNILLTISRGVQNFKTQGVDPWYAQAILMIESPGRLAKSNAGAYGSFQLMPDVARKFGLKVNKYVDERKDFDKSAVAASQLIHKVCIPEAKNILDAKEIEYNETDLWFRLFVMHIYHAGAGNVAGVINKINPKEGGMELIQQMWVTKEGRFGNASQNYSQLALAVMMVLDDMLWNCYS